jgi:hypothetical protein
MRASYVFSALAVVAMTSLGCGSSSTPAGNGGSGGGGDAAAGTGGTAGGGVGGTAGGGGSAGTGGMGGAGGTSILDCNLGTAADTCSRTERDTLNQCYATRCSAAENTCYGPAARMGTFAGVCKGFIECINNCGCGNPACALRCIPTYTAACMACQATIQSCRDTSMCVVPACAIRPDGGLTIPDGGLTIPDGGFPGLLDGGFTIPDGGFSGLFDGGAGTCTDLLSCCAAMTDVTARAQCNQQYALSQPYGDTVCGVVYQGHKAAGDCP